VFELERERRKQQLIDESWLALVSGLLGQMNAGAQLCLPFDPRRTDRQEDMAANGDPGTGKKLPRTAVCENN